MDLNYLVREPEVITQETSILFLMHGYGSNEEDLFSFVPTLPKDWIVISFRAPKSSPYGGYSWFDINLNDPENLLDEKEANETANNLLENILNIINRYNLSNNQVHLCGFSQGGMLTYSLALQHPELFNKIACLSTYPEEKLLRSINKDKKKIEKMRFFISHGMEDVVIPPEWGKRAADLLYDLSAYFSFREYISGHGVNQKNYLDLMEFFKK